MGGVSLRYFNVYGPGENHKGEMASFVYQAWKGWQQGHTPMLFPLNPKRDFVHVDDVIMANIAALDSFSELAGYYFEVGTGQARSFEDCLSIFDIPWSYTDEEKIPSGYQFHTQAMPSRFLPNWKPMHNLESGLRSYLLHLKTLSG